MNANMLFPLATIALVIGGIADSALSAPDREQDYQGIRFACAGVSEESRADPRWQVVDPAIRVRVAGGFLDGAEGIETAAVGELQVEQNGVEFSAGQALQPRRQRFHVFHLKFRLPGIGQQLANEQSVIRAVFDKQ